jgi:hypothetical protein
VTLNLLRIGEHSKRVMIYCDEGVMIHCDEGDLSML